MLLPLSSLPADMTNIVVFGDCVTLAVCVCAWILLKRRHLRAAATIILLLFFGALLYGSLAVFQTVRTPMIIGFVILIPMAGLLLGRKAMVAFVVLSCLALLTIFGLESWSVLKPQFNNHVTLNDLLVPIIAIGVHMLVLQATIRDSEESSADAQPPPLRWQEATLTLLKCSLNSRSARMSWKSV